MAEDNSELPNPTKTEHHEDAHTRAANELIERANRFGAGLTQENAKNLARHWRNEKDRPGDR